MKTVLGIFTDREDASSAIRDLRSEGYKPEDISILMKDKSSGEVLARDTGVDVAGGAMTGATTGALLGGLAGLAASFMLPGLGAFFIGGPVATALGLTGAAATTASGAATGALAGGILGILTGLGLSEDEARVYETHIEAGGILVAVPAMLGEEAVVERILSDYNADQINTISTSVKNDRFENRHSVDTISESDEEYSDYTHHYPTMAMKGGKTRRTSKDAVED